METKEKPYLKPIKMISYNVVTLVKTGVQIIPKRLKKLDFGVRRNDGKREYGTKAHI